MTFYWSVDIVLLISTCSRMYIQTNHWIAASRTIMMDGSWRISSSIARAYLAEVKQVLNLSESKSFPSRRFVESPALSVANQQDPLYRG